MKWQSHFTFRLLFRRDEDENEAEDLYSSLGPALSRFLPFLTPETETDFHSYSLKRLTEPIHKWKVRHYNQGMAI